MRRPWRAGAQPNRFMRTADSYRGGTTREYDPHGRAGRPVPICLAQDIGAEASMARYRMDLFKPGRRLGHRPALWRRHDIFAFDDGAAKVTA
jgi:hypothetical protein